MSYVVKKAPFFFSKNLDILPIGLKKMSGKIRILAGEVSKEVEFEK